MTATLTAGQPAPPFALTDGAGNPHRLSDYAGRWLVLYFYPKDDTAGCNREACGFRDAAARLEALNARVIGVSLDGPESHRRFDAKFRLGFPLLCDTGGAAARAYGSYFGVACIRLARRHTFIIDPEGRIARVYRRVQPARHGEQIVADLQALQTGTGGE